MSGGDQHSITVSRDDGLPAHMCGRCRTWIANLERAAVDMD